MAKMLRDIGELDARVLITYLIRTTSLTILLFTLACVSVPPSARAIGFDISWTGSNGYTMSGMFSYDDSLIGTGAIDETDLDTLMIEVFLNAASQGTWDLADGSGGQLSFNFNATTEVFVIGGDVGTTSGQVWNHTANPGVGFISGNAGQLISVNGAQIGFIAVGSSTLTATRKVVPEPSPLAFLLSGLGALAFAARQRTS
jgi:hypothetical protein